MANFTPDELAGFEMRPTWEALHATVAFNEAMARFVREELPSDVTWSAAGMTAANLLCCEFRNEIWPHYVPTTWELVLADRAGRLEDKIAELNETFARERRER